MELEDHDYMPIFRQQSVASEEELHKHAHTEAG